MEFLFTKTGNPSLKRYFSFLFRCFAGLILGLCVIFWLNWTYTSWIVDAGESFWVESKMVSLFGVTFVQPVEPMLFKDFITAFFLFSGSAITLLTFFILKLEECLGTDASYKNFFLYLGLGLFYGGTDELLGLHELLGYNFSYFFLPPDSFYYREAESLVVGIYGLAALGFLTFYKNHLLALKPGLYFFGLGIALNIGASVLDFVRLPFEESLEFGASICYFIGLLFYSMREIGNFIVKRFSRAENAET